MKKRTIFGLTLMAIGTAELFTPTFVSNAEILDDSTVGITYALDQYVSNLEIQEEKEESAEGTEAQ